MEIISDEYIIYARFDLNINTVSNRLATDELHCNQEHHVLDANWSFAHICCPGHSGHNQRLPDENICHRGQFLEATYP